MLFNADQQTKNDPRVQSHLVLPTTTSTPTGSARVDKWYEVPHHRSRCPRIASPDSEHEISIYIHKAPLSKQGMTNESLTEELFIALAESFSLLLSLSGT